MTNKTVVIYHRADFDGLFCREIAKKFLLEAELIGWDYGDPVPSVPPVCTLYILDLSIEELMDHGGLIWIDHHKTAIDKYPNTIPGCRIDGVAACRLTWQWFSIMEHNAQNQTNEALQCGLPSKEEYVHRKVSEPYAVQLAGEYDIWDKRDSNAELFQHGLKSQRLDGMWPLLLSSGELADKSVIHLLNAGTGIAYFRSQEYREVILEQGFDVEFEGHKYLACNSHELDIRSQLFDAGIKSHHEGLLGFTFTGSDWRVSLYGIPGKDIDHSEIAKRYGGGGHKNACGFRVMTLPFLPCS